MLEKIMSVNEFAEQNNELSSAEVLGRYSVYLSGVREDLSSEYGVSAEDLHTFHFAQQTKESITP